MADSTWWVNARDRNQISAQTPEEVEAEEWSDAYGTRIDKGNGAIWLNGVCIEGTPDELVEFGHALLSAAHCARTRVRS